MKKVLLTCCLAFALAAGIGFLVSAPAVDAEVVCNCFDFNYTLSSSATGVDCDAARANLETRLRILAEQDCKSRHGSESDDCNFQMDPIVSCYAIDFTGYYGASGSATYDCLVCHDKPNPPPGP